MEEQEIKEEKDIEGLLRELEGIYTSIEKFKKRVTIMFTDMVGSTKAFGEKGDILGMVMIQRHNDLLFPIIEEHKGTVIKTIGDAIMALFEDPFQAVLAAVKMQQRIEQYNQSRLEKDEIHIRIGINSGTGIIKDRDVFGDVVNLASRLQSIAGPDEIMVSKAVFEVVKGSEGLSCQFHGRKKVKGIAEEIDVYRVLWKDEEELGDITRSPYGKRPRKPEKKKVFLLEIFKEEDRVRICAHERPKEEERTLRLYEDRTISSERIDEHCQNIISLLNSANKSGWVSKEILRKLQKEGHILYDEILTVQAKEKLRSTQVEDLILYIDDQLVQIPWELLYDGESFFCQRFNMGRIVRTRQEIPGIMIRSPKKPIKMLILADPRGDLKASYEEGIKIRDELLTEKDLIHVDIKTSSIDTGYVKKSIRDYDLVHYAGHADYDEVDPSKSGWIMADGKFSASDIAHMAGGGKPLPSLIFSNACQSGHTEEWRVHKGYGKMIYGLANAFLLAGVQHYIGTFWEILDRPSSYFALEFYREIIKGASMGEALREARSRFIKRYGEENILWASYMLYGDPTYRLIDAEAVYVEVEEDTAEWKKDEEGKGPIHMQPPLAIEGKRKKKVLWSSISALLFMLAIIAILSILAIKVDLKEFVSKPSIQKEIVVEDKEKQKRINEMIALLTKRYEEQQRVQKPELEKDTWTSKPLTMTLMDFKNKGRISQNDTMGDYIFSRLTQSIQSSGRVHILERKKLDDLLEELKLSSSELANHELALVLLGKILGARLISVGDMVEYKGERQLSLRIFETETSAIKIAVERNGLDKGTLDEMVQGLGQEILKKAIEAYPLKGRIASIDGNKVVINIGSRDGVRPGLVMKILGHEKPIEMYGKIIGYEDKEIGKLRITDVRDQISFGEIVAKRDEIKRGDRVLEEQAEDGD